jgi:hypothetical protein
MGLFLHNPFAYFEAELAKLVEIKGDKKSLHLVRIELLIFMEALSPLPNRTLRSPINMVGCVGNFVNDKLFHTFQKIMRKERAIRRPIPLSNALRQPMIENNPS